MTNRGIRYTKSVKFEILRQLHLGLASREEILARHNLTNEELLSWEKALESHGPTGLGVRGFLFHRHEEKK